MKKVLIFFLVAVAIAMVLPSFADQVSKSLADDDNTDIKKGWNPRSVGTFNNTFNATDRESKITTNNALTPAQIQKLTETQNKLAALINKIDVLKTKYANLKSKGLLNALDQYKKQANSLNSEISAFIQAPNGNIDAKINSFVKREADLEHKVSIKEDLLIKMSTKQVKVANSNDESKVQQQQKLKEEKKNNKKNKK